MLLDDDVVTDRQPKAGALASWLGGEEGIEHLFPDLRRDPNTIIPDPNLYAVAEALGRSGDCRLKPVPTFLPLAFGGRIEAIGDQVQEHPRNLLRKSVDLTGRGIEGSLQVDIEALLLRAGTVIGKVKAFLDQGID